MTPEAIAALLNIGGLGVVVILGARAISWMGAKWVEQNEAMRADFKEERTTWQGALAAMSENLAAISTTLKEVCDDLKEHRRCSEESQAKHAELITSLNGSLGAVEASLRRICERLNDKT